MFNERVFREYDVRGVVGKDIDRDFALVLGKAFASLLKKVNPDAKRVSIGRDARLSSEEFAMALTSGILNAGLDVVDIGLCPTPLQYFSIFHLGLDGGIMVTGSHNPPEYNGFKLSIGKMTIFGKDIQTLREIAAAEAWDESPESGKIEKYDIVTAYMKSMKQRFSYLSGDEYRRLKIVVDAGNGTAGIVAPEILRAMGCDVFPLYCEPDGRFPNHHPDPTVVEYIQDLIDLTKREKADMGVGYDGDADRIGVVSRDGKIIWGDQMMIVLARDILTRNPGSTVIGDVKCSQLMFDDVRKHGGVPVMWKTGHSLVKSKMKEEGALLAGEFSGHIFISEGYYGYDDALYTTFRLVEIMKKSGKGIHDLLADIPQMYFTPEIRVECREEEKKLLVEHLVAKCKEYAEKGNGPIPIQSTNDTDGVRVLFERGWGLVRSSNTQPVIVMRFEAEDESSLNQYRSFMEKELEKAGTRQ